MPKTSITTKINNGFSILFPISDIWNRFITIIKILFRPNISKEWNKIPSSSENVYVVSTFKEILEIFEFNEKLKEEGIELGTL